MLPRQSLRRADVVASVAFMALGAIVIYRASQMPWASARTGGSVQWYLSPGLFPVVVGALLILFSARVLLNALKEGGQHGIADATRAWFAGLPRNRGVHRVAIISVLLAIYVFGAVGRVNFVAASAIFLFVSIALFWWPANGRSMAASAGITAVIAVSIPLAITWIFTTFLFVPMP
jgi:hypothetical protein